MDPINYMMPQTNPVGNLIQGLQAGTALRQIRDQRAAQEQATQMQEQFRTDFGDYMTAPSYDKLTALQVKYPGMSEAFKPLTAKMDKDQLSSDLNATYQALAAIRSGKSDIAVSTIDRYIEAAKNSGLNTSKLEQIKTAIETNPEGAAAQIEWMAGVLDPEMYKKFTEAQAKSVETAQSEKLFPEKQAQEAIKTQREGYETAIKSEEAKIAPQKVQAEYQKTLAETNKMLQEPEFERQRIAIARQKNAIDSETNNIARQTKQLQLIKMQQEYMDKVNEKTAKVYAAYDNLQNSKKTIDKALQYFSIGKVGGYAAAERAHGPIASMVKTVDPDVANYERLLDTIGSQTFLKAVQDVGGMSGLTEVEGQKLQSAIANISLNQGPKQAKQNLILIKNMMEKSFKTLEKKYGINVKQEKSKERRNISGADAAAALGI